MSLAGHFWTIAPPFLESLRGFRTPPASPWHAHVDDERSGRVRLAGLLTEREDARGLLVIVHGLGGRHTSHYCARAAAAAHAAGLSTLRLAQRGADRSGEDFPHAGLTADLHAALASPEVQGHDAVYFLGYSMGGHLALRLAAEEHDPRLRAVAAACPPLDLARSAHAFDREIAWPYRRHVLGGLKSIYREVARRREVPTPPALVDRAGTIREWDRMTVVPRHGFRDVDDYYGSQSVAPLLSSLRVPALVVVAHDDPVVPASSVRSALGNARGVDVRWTRRGGHVGFPGDLDLGLPGGRGLEAQVIGWLLGHGSV